MQATPQALAAIRELRAQRKFVPAGMYPGAPDEEILARCEATIDLFLDETLTLLSRDTPKEEFLLSAKRMLDAFSEEDTEEREQADTYIGEVMSAVEIDDWTDFI